MTESIYGPKSKGGVGSLTPTRPSKPRRSQLWRPFFGPLWIPLLLVTFSGCSLLGSVTELEGRISEIDTLIFGLKGELESATPEERNAITIEIDTLTARKNALIGKAEKAKKLKEAAGSGVSAALGILATVLGIPALGAGAPFVKRLITGA